MFDMFSQKVSVSFNAGTGTVAYRVYSWLQIAPGQAAGRASLQATLTVPNLAFLRVMALLKQVRACVWGM